MSGSGAAPLPAREKLAFHARQQLVLWRQPWQARRSQRGWRSPWLGLGIVAVAMAAFVVVWPARWLLWICLFALMGLAWHGWLAADGLHRQNRPSLARLLPGHVRALRLQLLLHSVLATAAAVAVLTLTLGAHHPWLWLLLPLVVLWVWLPREPWLWVFMLFGGVSVPLWRWAAEAANATPSVKLLALLGTGALIAAAIGGGGTLHRWQAARGECWRHAAEAQLEGRGIPAASLSWAGRLVMRLFDWPSRLWRRRLLAQGAAAPLAARLDLGLGLGGRWAELLWAATLLFGGLAIALGLAWLREPEQDLSGRAEVARFGICIGAFSLVGSALYGRLGSLWARRREQALLALLPGVQPYALALLERRWRREYLLSWLPATALVLAVGAVGSAGSLAYTAACAALCLPLAWLTQHRQRRLLTKPNVVLLTLAPFAAAGLAWPIQQLGVPAWASLALGVLGYAALARRRDPVPLSLPVGRAGPQV